MESLEMIKVKPLFKFTVIGPLALTALLGQGQEIWFAIFYN